MNKKDLMDQEEDQMRRMQSYGPELRKRNRSSLDMMGLASILALSLPPGQRIHDSVNIDAPPIKKCLNCGNDHTTNKAYCSAKCCGEHRRKLRDAR